jgi:hypothetical protein
VSDVGWTAASACVTLRSVVSPTIGRVDDAALVGFDRDLLIGIWWGSATLDHVTAMRACSDQILREHPKFATAVIVMDGDGVFTFTPEVRKALADYVKETESSGLGSAFVILRGGFMGATVRAFISGLFLLTRSKEPQKAFATVAQAAAWLSRCYEDGAPDRPRTADDLDSVLGLAIAQTGRKG